MKDKITQKQETFCLNILKGIAQRDAYLQAGYSANQSAATIDIHASQLAASDKIKIRLSELRLEVKNDVIAGFEERQKILSEIARARVTDYQELGQDGSWINIGPESPNTSAISEIVSTTKYDNNGADPTVISRVRLHNPIEAIKELNKMDGIYTDGTNVTNNILNINAKDLSDDELADIAKRGSDRAIGTKTGT